MRTCLSPTLHGVRRDCLAALPFLLAPAVLAQPSWQPARDFPGRHYTAMAYDVARARMVTFGGDSIHAYLDRTQEWDGSRWIDRSPATNPGARWSNAMAYLFPLASPPPRNAHAMTWDAARQRIVLHGGKTTQPSPRLLADTWEYDGVTWTASPATRPRATEPVSLAYDAGQQRTALFTESGTLWFHGTFTPPALHRFGSGCTGSNGTPALAAATPFVGNRSFVLDLSPLPGSAPCAVVLAAGTASRALGGGCTLYVTGANVPLLTTSNVFGFASVGVPIPVDSRLRGMTLFAQGVALDPLGGFAGLSFSDALQVVLGD